MGFISEEACVRALASLASLTFLALALFYMFFLTVDTDHTKPCHNTKRHYSTKNATVCHVRTRLTSIAMANL